MITVAALYIDPRGPYPKMPGVDCWDEKRDARLYGGPHPVVAHPPCGAWSGSRHLYRGSEADCAIRAVVQVRKLGGVLEHPAESKLWEHFATDASSGADALPFPGQAPDVHGGYTLEVSQVEWGHVARKRTWLYLVGVPRSALEAPPFPGREPTHWCSGRRGMAKAVDNVPPGIKVCSAQQRRRTPPLFAEYLVRLAHAAERPTESQFSRRMGWPETPEDEVCGEYPEGTNLCIACASR